MYKNKLCVLRTHNCEFSFAHPYACRLVLEYRMELLRLGEAQMGRNQGGGGGIAVSILVDSSWLQNNLKCQGWLTTLWKRFGKTHGLSTVTIFLHFFSLKRVRRLLPTKESKLGKNQTCPPLDLVPLSLQNCEEINFNCLYRNAKGRY